MRYRYLQTRGALQDSAGRPREMAANRRGALWRGQRIPPEVSELIPESLARENRAVAVAVHGETVIIASETPDDLTLSDKLTFVMARKVRLVPASQEEIGTLIADVYGAPRTETVDSMLQEFYDVDEVFMPDPPQSAPVHTTAPRPDDVFRRVGILESRGMPGRPATTQSLSPRTRSTGLDPTRPLGGSGMFTHVVEEGQRALMRRPDGSFHIIIGPKRVWRGRNQFLKMEHYVAHPGDYLIVRYRDGRQEHFAGPSEVWFDPRIHQEVTREEALQVAAKEAVVVYSSKEGSSAVQRRIEYGPTLFMPRPGEWLHTFAWHSSSGGSQGVRKEPRGLVFQKLWLMPDQMYHDVPDVRTADDAVLTIRLMIFFELLDITTMLETTHDPIGDFVNATTSDVVDFTGRHDFESFKRNTDKLNELETYRQLLVRATQCGYRINKVVYRGYGAPDRLQQMHDQAIEARTKLQLERATEQQAQELENFKLDSQMLRAGKRRHEQTSEVEHELELARTRQAAELRDREARLAFEREQRQLAEELRERNQAVRDTQQRNHLEALRGLNVDLTALLTQSRADRVIELRGSQGAPHVHIDTNHDGVRPSQHDGRD